MASELTSMASNCRSVLKLPSTMRGCISAPDALDADRLRHRAWVCDHGRKERCLCIYLLQSSKGSMLLYDTVAVVKKCSSTRILSAEKEHFINQTLDRHAIDQNMSPSSTHHNTTANGGPAKKKLIINAFVESCSGHQSPGLWRHPRDKSWDFNNVHHWVELAQLLERAHFHGMFIADVLVSRHGRLFFPSLFLCSLFFSFSCLYLDKVRINPY